LDTCHHLNGSNVLDALDLNQVSQNNIKKDEREEKSLNKEREREREREREKRE